MNATFEKHTTKGYLEKGVLELKIDVCVLEI